MEIASPAEPIIENLVSKGWCFRDVDEMHFIIQSIPLDGKDKKASVGLVEAELLNMDLRDIGGVSLPDPSVIKKSSHLQGPKILQVASVRDISQSSIEVAFNSFQHRHRLLRFSLTDGHSEIIAVEYKAIPSITDVIVPGIKVLLQHKTPIHSGIICLDSVTLKVLGGVVQTLYEEWEVNQKYSGFARSSIRAPKAVDDDGGPPQFEKLQINSPDLHNSSSSNALVKLNGSSSQRQMSYKMEDSSNTASVSGQAEEKSTQESRPKEVAEALPVQNQAAAQKLLQKMNQSHWDGRQIPAMTRELAWQLQNQLDLEECNVRREENLEEEEEGEEGESGDLVKALCSAEIKVVVVLLLTPD
ncbi:hypothetical protein H6P81_003875 [Aristolochia fimbriata]|uniref:RecQ mediated genome instability protein 1 OB-fold domain-containing protein n=1 Tax=Aristolochia fimbriata TaxID=158543 RepID=A0AAV7FDU4_ARIFI|nr:hypothetical protein H6P81_003875 [Aristolochia fimbriata]